MRARGLLAGVFVAATIAPATALAVASAELYRTEAYRYGRFEARIRYAPGNGVISSFFLWKAGSEVSGTYWNELDFEKLENCRMQTNALYGTPVNSTEQSHTMPTDMCDAYHDYAFEWTPTYIAWFIDGREIRRDMGAIAEAFAQNAPQGMEIHFNVWPGNEEFGGNFNPAILPVRQYISWVQYSSFQNGNFTVQWREDFNGSTLPTGWVTGDWASPKNLSTHNPQNVTFANGISVLSLTADNNTGFTGVPPADTGGSGGMSGGGGKAGAGGAGGAGAGGTATGGGGTAGQSPAGTGGTTAVGGGGATAGGTAGGGAAGTGMAGKGGAPISAGGAATSGATAMAGTTTVAGSSVGGSTNAAGALGSAGVGGTPGGSDNDGGCGFAVNPGRTSALFAVCAGLAGLLLRRRRSSAVRESARHTGQ